MSSHAHTPHRPRRPSTSAAQQQAVPPRSGLAPASPPRDDRALLARVVDTPELARAVPALPAGLIHRVVDRCGLEASAGLLALVSPEQLVTLFDLDLWRGAVAGGDEQFDAARFAEWLQVMAEHDPAVAARHLAALDPGLVVGALSSHIGVFDRGAVSAFETLEGEWRPGRDFDSVLSAELGGFVVVAKNTDSWDAVTSVLGALGTEHPGHFRRVMLGCRRLSDAGHEIDELEDLLDAASQVRFDSAAGREGRREARGFVSPAQARAFLQSARQIDVHAPARPSPDPIAAAYFASLEAAVTANAPAVASDPPASSVEAAALSAPEAIETLVQLLSDASVPATPRPLLGDGASEGQRPSLMEDHLQRVSTADPEAYAARARELVFLANVLVAGGSVAGRAFTVREASDAVAAACSLGMERWPTQWTGAETEKDAGAERSDDDTSNRDLIPVFQVGWTILYREVSLAVAGELLEAVSGLTCSDRETERGLGNLRRQLTAAWRNGTPWRARDALDVLAIFDLPVWAALLALFGECPVLLANVRVEGTPAPRTIDPSKFDFVATGRQIEAVRRFMASVAAALTE